MNTTTSSSTFVVPHRALGVSDPGEIPDSAFLASSQRNPLDYSAAKALKEGANLDSEEWCSYYNDTNQWLQAKLSYVNRNRRLNKMELIFINSSIQLYRINTSMDGENWSFENEVNIKTSKHMLKMWAIVAGINATSAIQWFFSTLGRAVARRGKFRAPQG